MDRKYEYRRCLPHYQKDDRTLFITFATLHRWILPSIASRKLFTGLYAAVVMPDHVHLICLPLSDINGPFSIPEITQAIKGESAHRINRVLGRRGSVWQDESFDHVLRRDESVLQKTAYILNNPVRAGLVKEPSQYRWLWWDEALIANVLKPRASRPRPH